MSVYRAFHSLGRPISNHLHACIYVCIYAWTYACIYVSIYGCIYVSIYACVYVPICMYELRRAYFLLIEKDIKHFCLSFSGSSVKHKNTIAISSTK